MCISPLIYSNPRPFSGWTLQWIDNLPVNFCIIKVSMKWTFPYVAELHNQTAFSSLLGSTTPQATKCNPATRGDDMYIPGYLDTLLMEVTGIEVTIRSNGSDDSM